MILVRITAMLNYSEIYNDFVIKGHQGYHFGHGQRGAYHGLH